MSDQTTVKKESDAPAKEDGQKNEESKADLKEGADKPKIRIKVQAFDHKIIDRATKTIIDTAKRTQATVKGPVPLPTEISKYTVNRSTFVHKDSREQFEMRIHKRLIDIYDPKSGTINDLMNLALPSGVDVQIKM